MLFGRKAIPDPQARRSGILPSRSTRGLIGNRALLQAVDRLLGIESVGGTPSEFDISAVIPVIDIRAAGRPQPVIRYIESTIDISGLNNVCVEAYQPPENQYGEVFAGDITIDFNGVPAAGNQISALWELSDAPPNGADHRVPVGGYVPQFPIVTEANVSEYRAPLACASVGGSASPPWVGNRGIVYGQNFQGSPRDPMGLFVSAEYFTAATVAQVWPALTNLIVKVWVREFPVGATPLYA